MLKIKTDAKLILLGFFWYYCYTNRHNNHFYIFLESWHIDNSKMVQQFMVRCVFTEFLAKFYNFNFSEIYVFGQKFPMTLKPGWKSMIWLLFPNVSTHQMLLKLGQSNSFGAPWKWKSMPNIVVARITINISRKLKLASIKFSSICSKISREKFTKLMNLDFLVSIDK